MRVSTLPWRMCLLLLSSLSLHGLEARAGPAINVALKASFHSAPYLVELLETAAFENATSYFPLLDSIADGTFTDLGTEKELYDKFLDVLQKDGHIRDAEALSSFNFALALRTASPRIQAHFQYYNTSVEPGMMAAQDAACPVWVYLNGKQYCSPSLDRAQQGIPEDEGEVLPFDRVLAEDSDGPHSIIYADITHPLFGQFHETVSKTAKEGKTSYRVRYRPSATSEGPLYVNGYGVELVLKRTDYIVIDDREDAKSTSGQSKQAVIEDVHDEEPTDLKPLTSSELTELGLRSGSFIVNSASPLDTLLNVSANFPRYSSLIASQNATAEFLTEYRANRAAFLPSGFNILWVNGLQVEARQINAFSMHEHLKRERKLIGQLRDLGLTAAEAISLLSHEVIAQAQAEDEPQRYDWRDDIEGGEVIMWLNDIEQDNRYQTWPSELNALLQRSFAGQLPSVRRDIHNLILPVDLSNIDDLETIVNVLQNFVKRTVPIRIGLVPSLTSQLAVGHAKLAYHILETYGLSALMSFLEGIVTSKTISSAAEASFMAAITGIDARDHQPVLSYHEVLDADSFHKRMESIEHYLSRLDLSKAQHPFFINGIALPYNDNWLDAMSNRISYDLRVIQRGVYQQSILDDMWVPNFFLFQAALRRNALVIPEDIKSVKVLDVADVIHSHPEAFENVPQISGEEATLLSECLHLLLVADLDSTAGQNILSEAVAALQFHPEIELLILHNPMSFDLHTGLAGKLLDAIGEQETISPAVPKDVLRKLLEEQIPGGRTSDGDAEKHNAFWKSKSGLVNDLGYKPGETGLWLNGRLVGPITESFTAEDFETLFTFEISRRVMPVTTAITSLGLEEKFQSPLDLAKATSLISRAHKSDVPEGIYESAPLIRIDKFRLWNDTHSAIRTSNSQDPTIQIVAAIDPASEVVQHWIPILKVLSELQGVDVTIHLNPKEKILELPVKRFYRQVVQSAPTFDEAGALTIPRASFTGIPHDALLNLGMVVPPSWLVAPKECIYDLDNIKLSSLPVGQNIEAIYELEHILIEGHSRDVTLKGPPPRGAQLLLGTQRVPHFTDTLVMANLGYFQFKANPGYWQISLQPGRSSKIFNIDSVGSNGYAPQPGDETTSVALLSFQGTTLFPRLSRNPGMEDEDVLESRDSALSDIFAAGASFLSSVGLGGASRSLTTSSSQKHADINIFSVASGHLYERMLNIMMLSVMKHTTHSVKFWFIEQFLSPSFKSFLPHLAAHYNFQFEMVTYKWPHWLRAQKEKQREIWGYKILFLDVLFPLSLDKIIFVDADQIVRTDLMNLNNVDLHGAPYGFTPMCDSRTEMEGFRFWKQGYWKTFLAGKPYHISALYVVDLRRFRALASGDRLRQQYQQLSADPASLSNLDQDLPNHMQHVLPIHSLSQEWLWCETWCSDESLGEAKTIDLCNNPLTKEPKLERARRQVPEWTVYDEEVEGVRRLVSEREVGRGKGGHGDGVRKIDEL